MSEDSERIKRLVAFKQDLEKKVVEVESELKGLQATLETVNSLLIEKGFKRAEITKSSAEMEAPSPKMGAGAEPSPSQPQAEYESAMQLRAANGELLATLYLTDDSLRLVPTEGRDFNVNTSPFTQFLVEKVLAKMQEKDGELVRSGQITPDEIFSYSILREGDIIREITIKHVDEDRLRELKSSIRWTLEKMYEKMTGQS
jgi:hypothetical protein